MPDGYTTGWKLLDAVSTPKLESFARCLTGLFADSVCLWRDFDRFNAFRICLSEVVRLAMTFELMCCLNGWACH
jgi:hypothetical protein